MAKRKRLKLILIPLVALILAGVVISFATENGRSRIKGLFAMASRGGGQAGSNNPAQSGRGNPGGGFGGGFGAAFPVRAEGVKRESISEYILTNTTLDPDKQVDVLSQASGLVVEILVEEGEGVSAGDILARLDQREVLLEVESAKLRVESALKAFKLSEEMLKNGAVSQEEYNAKKYQLDTSDLQLDAAKIKLDNTEIKSPIDGIVTGRHIHVGDTVRSTQAVFSVGDFEPLFARIHVPEKEIERIRIGQEARVSVESASDQEFKGVVKMISPIVDAQTGTIKITIQIDEGRGILKPGMFATVYIATQTHPSALVISKKALVLEREEEVVFTVEEGVARRVPVKTGFDDSNRVEILSGLKEGDRVITVGQDGLRDGASVRAVGEVAVAERAAPEVRGAGGDRPSGPPAGGRPDSPAGGRQVSESRQPSEGGGQGGFRAGSSGGGFNLSQLPPDRRKALEERMLGNPQIKDEYEKKLKEDPGLATDPEKRAKFFGEMMARFRGGQ